MRDSQYAIKSGVIFGIICVIYSLIYYMLGADFAGEYMWSSLIFVLLLSIGAYIYFGKSYRRNVGGYVNFKELFIVLFVITFISGLINSAFGILLYQVIDPDYPVQLVAAIKENTISMMEGFNVPEEEIEKAIADMDADMKDQFSFTGMAMQFVKGIIFNAVVAAIMAAILKKNEPLIHKEDTLD